MRNWKLLLSIATMMGATLSANAMVTGTKADKKAEKASALSAEAVEGEFVVKFSTNNASIQSMAANLETVGLSIKKVINRSANTYSVKLTNKAALAKHVGVKSEGLDIRQAVITAATALANIEYIEPNFVYRVADVPNSRTNTPQTTPNDTEFAKLWAMNNTGGVDVAGHAGKVNADIDAPEAWTVATGSKDIVVAVIDTGVDYTHPDLAANVWTGPNGIHGHNAITGTDDPMDDHSHGTHCSGTIGAVGDDGKGIVGINWHVSIMGSKFLSSQGSGTLEDAIKAIDWATDHGAQIMSNSWGGGGFSQALLDSITRANKKGILFIAAAGNDSTNNDSAPSYPASYQLDNIVSVAASNNQDMMSDFSNYGKSVNLMAPGENIYSTVLNHGYDTYSGTSMATPHVSGAAALLLSKEPSLTPVQVRDRLMATSDKLKAYRNKLQSGGRLNLYNLVTNTIPPGFVSIPDSAWKLPVTQALASGHPYVDGAALKWEIKQPGASFVRLHFAKFQTESGYDKLIIKDKAGNVVDTLTGNLGQNFWSTEVEGDTMTIEFVSDSSINDYGFQIDQLGWTDFTGQ